MESEIDVIKSIFKPDLFNVEKKDGNIFINSTDGNENCLELKIIKDTIKIELLKKCNTNGSFSLSLVEELARIMPNIRNISLYDGSKIKTNCGYVVERDGVERYIYINLDLATLKILTTGMSWYNKHGYISRNFEKEQKHNSKILQMSFENVMNLWARKAISKFIGFLKLSPEDISNIKTNIETQKEMLMDEARRLFPDINPSITIKDYVIKMLELINNRFDSSDESSCKKYAFISNLLQLLTNLLYYNRDLTKEINKPPVGGKSKKQSKKQSKRKSKRKKLFSHNM